ncbi:MAG: tetratricopeptide repeat protein [Bacteroidota bacterium]
MDAKPERALFLTDSSLSMSQDISYKWGIGNSFYIKAYLFAERNELDEALLYYLKADHVFKNIRQDKFVKEHLDVTLNIGVILSRNKNHEEAIKLYLQAIKVADEDLYSKRRLQLLYNLSSTYRDWGDLSNAIDYLEQTARLANKLENSRLLLKSWNLLGLIHQDNGDFDKSRQFYEKIISHNSANDEAISKAYHNLANTYVKVSDYRKAELLFKKALLIKRNLDKPHILFRTLREMARVNVATVNLEIAEKFAREAEEIYSDIYHVPETFEIFHMLHSIYNQIGDYEKANNYANKYAKEVTYFYEQQKTIISLKDQFKTDLILAGFQQELAAKVKAEMFWKWIYAILFVFSIIILVLYVKRMMMRRIVSRAIVQLQDGAF